MLIKNKNIVLVTGKNIVLITGKNIVVITGRKRNGEERVGAELISESKSYTCFEYYQKEKLMEVGEKNATERESGFFKEEKMRGRRESEREEEK